MWTLLACASLAIAAPWEWRGEIGGEFNADPHGIATAAFRTGPFQVGLYTDTLDARWAPEWEGGRSWAALRFEGGAAGLMISPWTDGAPDPARAVAAFYAGGEAGLVGYLPRGAWLGTQFIARYWFFGPRPKTDRPLPDAQMVATGDLIGGVWSPEASVAIRAGFDLRDDAEPHLHVDARWEPRPGPIGPRAELRAGVASGQDEITRTRLGGLNPYVVPLAGAAWGEWWVEDYAAMRLGPSLHVGRFRGSALLDAAWFDHQTALGFALTSHLDLGRLTIDGAIGYAPWIPRGSFPAVAAYLVLGTPWKPIRARREKTG